MEKSNEALFLTDEARWEALVQRERQADGRFVYGVLTTGIYCRPTCASRRPNRENVLFFSAGDQAEQAGFRPCKRCRPNAADNSESPQTQAIIKACQTIETAETAPSLNELAQAAGLSPYHFQRLFKKVVGVTPKQYAMEHRLNRVRRHLQQDSTVTEAVYNAGFASSSRFYEKAAHSLGMKPSVYQKGAQAMPIKFATTPSYLGWVLIAATGQGLCAIDFGDAPETLQARLRARFPQADLQADDPDFQATVSQLLAFLEAPHHSSLDLPLDIQGTAFQRRVWQALQNIPVGSTASYAEIAGQIGQPQAARAVAQACASNTLAVAIPCHRVVRSNGDLGGYRWGLKRKRMLLAREAAGEVTETAAKKSAAPPPPR